MSLAMAERQSTARRTARDQPASDREPSDRHGRPRSVDALLVAYHRDGDRGAREAALVELMPLVRSLAARYAGRGEPLDDLVQVGALGLIKAVDRFDVSRGVEFTSYGVPTIVGEIRRHFRDKAWAMHVPRRIKELSVRLSRLLDDLTTSLGRSPTISELAEAAAVEEEDVIDALDAARAYSTRSLDAVSSGGSSRRASTHSTLGRAASSSSASSRRRPRRRSRPSSESRRCTSRASFATRSR
jgi:RNA polymerase sigma-B factor